MALSDWSQGRTGKESRENGGGSAECQAATQKETRMNRYNSKEVRERFGIIQRRKIEEWEKQNPEPKRPTAMQVARELRGGKFRVNEEAIERWQDDEHCCFDSVIRTHSMAALSLELERREARKKKFEEELQRSKEDFLDRVIFDHESAFTALQSFRKWRDSTQPETFDGP